MKKYGIKLDKARERVANGLDGGTEAGRSVGLRGHSDGGDTNQHNRKVGSLERMATDKTGGEILPSNSKRVVEQNSPDKQNVKYSFSIDDDIAELTPARTRGRFCCLGK